MNTAIITGTSSGLGTEFLDAVIEKYPDMEEIWILARRLDRLEKLKEKYPDRNIVPIRADLGNEKDYQNIAEMLEEKKPDIRILINNAGYEKSDQFSQMDTKAILNMIGINIKGMTMIQRLCMPYMSRGSFSVITCSISSFVPVPHQAVYSASKMYAYYLGKAIREEAKKDGINVLLLCPGNMNTEMNPKGSARQSKKINKLPFLDMKVLTRTALSKAEKGNGVYTPGGFYKFYRAMAGILPSALMIKIIGNAY